MSWTKPRSRTEPPRADAAALYNTADRDLHVFREYAKTAPPYELTIGRARAADITIPEMTMSSWHAFIECGKDLQCWIRPHRDKIEVFIDGHRINGPARLLVGMEVCLGDLLFVATDDQGGFPLLVNTIDEMAWKASERLGGARPAGRRIGRSHNTIIAYAARHEAALIAATGNTESSR